MSSASQSEPDVATARRLVGDIEGWKSSGRRLASPVWFPLLCAAITMLASVPASIVLGQGSSAGIYWAVAAPVTAIASGWFFATRRAQPPVATAALTMTVGLALLAATLILVFVYKGAWAEVAPWLAVGTGFGLFAAAWRSITTAVFAAVCVGTSIGVAVADPVNGYAILALAIGLTAALAVFAELVRAVPVSSV